MLVRIYKAMNNMPALACAHTILFIFVYSNEAGIIEYEMKSTLEKAYAHREHT